MLVRQDDDLSSIRTITLRESFQDVYTFIAWLWDAIPLGRSLFRHVERIKARHNMFLETWDAKPKRAPTVTGAPVWQPLDTQQISTVPVFDGMITNPTYASVAPRRTRICGKPLVVMEYSLVSFTPSTCWDSKYQLDVKIPRCYEQSTTSCSNGCHCRSTAVMENGNPRRILK